MSAVTECGARPGDGAVPEWLDALARRARDSTVEGLSQAGLLRDRHAPEGAATRPAAVLILFGERESGPAAPADADGVPDVDVLLTQRAATLRHHSGQVAFPGGATDAGDRGPVHTALREAEEETGLRPEGVEPVAVLPELFIPPSGYLVSPVLAYWRSPSPVGVVDSAEAVKVSRVPLRDLVDPANRYRVRYRRAYEGPAFVVDGMLVWGFTAGVLTAIISEAGWEREWDTRGARELDTMLAQVGGQASSR